MILIIVTIPIEEFFLGNFISNNWNLTISYPELFLLLILFKFLKQALVTVICIMTLFPFSNLSDLSGNVKSLWPSLNWPCCVVRCIYITIRIIFEYIHFLVQIRITKTFKRMLLFMFYFNHEIIRIIRIEVSKNVV